MNNILENQFPKSVHESVDIEYHMERLKSFPEGEWFQPNNHGDNMDYDICEFMFHHHLIARRSEPIWNNGSFRGVRVFFLYKLDMQY